MGWPEGVDRQVIPCPEGLDELIAMVERESVSKPCVVCGGVLMWIECPTGSWWAHVVHPANNHDGIAEGVEDEFVVTDDGITVTERSSLPQSTILLHPSARVLELERQVGQLRQGLEVAERMTADVKMALGQNGVVKEGFVRDRLKGHVQRWEHIMFRVDA